jgi:pimeloyl-ACP methyl ester carboxylesterase
MVRRLVLVAPFGLWLDDHQIPDIFGLGDSALKAALWHNPEAVPAPSTNGMSPIDIIIRRTEDMAVAAKFLWPIPDRGLIKRLPYIKAPTLVITGGADGIIPAAYGGAFEQAIPNATSITITDAGHYPMVEQEDLFIDEVTRFLGA